MYSLIITEGFLYTVITRYKCHLTAPGRLWNVDDGALRLLAYMDRQRFGKQFEGQRGPHEDEEHEQRVDGFVCCTIYMSSIWVLAAEDTSALMVDGNRMNLAKHSPYDVHGETRGDLFKPMGQASDTPPHHPCLLYVPKRGQRREPLLVPNTCVPACCISARLPTTTPPLPAFWGLGISNGKIGRRIFSSNGGEARRCPS